jgi:opacity protein-like surface antigen
MQRNVLHGLIMAVVVMLSGGLLDAMAQEIPAGESSSDQAPVSEKRKTEFYGALSILGTMPTDKNLTVGGTTIFNTNVKGSVGAGLKAGIFPKFAGGIFGVEGEVFGHGGKLNAPGQAQGDLTVINFMVNVLARYPGEIIQPYVGAGIGVSAGHLSDANIQVAGSQLTGKARDGAGAFQFLGGVRAYVTKKVFLFGEYKYFAANYKWESEGISTGSPSVKLDFRTQIISGGIGISF